MGEGTTIKIPIALITRDFLLTNNVTGMDTLDVVMPELLLPDFRAGLLDRIRRGCAPGEYYRGQFDIGIFRRRLKCGSKLGGHSFLQSLAFPLALFMRPL